MEGKKKSKSEQAYDYILEKIISREYKPKDKIIISTVAKQVGISEIPVREALRQLEGDGYIRIVPNHGAICVGIDRVEVYQLVEVKGVLEGFATRLAVDYISTDLLDELWEMNRRMEKACKSNDADRFSALNYDFHLKICLQCHNNELIKELQSVWKRWTITKNVFYGQSLRMEASCEEHKVILKMIGERNYAEIENYVRMHKFNSKNYWLANG